MFAGASTLIGRMGPQITRLVLCLGAALTGIMVGIVTWTLFDTYRAFERDAGRRAGTIALEIERDVSHTVTVLDLALQTAVEGMLTPNLMTLDPALRQQVLFGGTAAAEKLGGVLVADAGGTIIYASSDTTARNFNVSGRQHFKFLKDHPEAGLVVTQAVRFRGNGRYGIILARRINAADGAFAGVASAAVDLEYFRSLFASLSLGRSGTVSVSDTSGFLVVGHPYVEGDFGKLADEGELIAHVSRAETGHFEARPKSDGLRRLYSYRQIGHLPLFVSVGLSTQDVFRGFVARAWYLVGAVMVMILLGASMAWALRVELRRRTIAEREHVRARARIDALFNSSADSMMVARVAPDGSFIYEAANPVWARLAGRPPETVIGRTPEQCLPPEMIEDTLPAWQRCLRERKPIHYSFRTGAPDGDILWDALVAPVFEEDGQVGRMIAVGRDVTKRAGLEVSLRRAQRLEAVGQLTAGLAHDFNNLLQVILGALEMLQTHAGLDAKARRYAGVAQNAADRGATLVHRLLAFSRKQALTPVQLNPHQVIAGVLPLLNSAVGKPVHLEVEVQDGAWDICADCAQLDDCLFNLAINARDAMPEGGTLRLSVENATLTVDNAACLPEGEYLRFAVSDNGLGMTPEIVARALEPFFTTKPVGTGTGLGLSMVQGYARQSGGDLSIVSTPGHGTTVTLWLPRAAGVATTVETRPQAWDASDGVRGRILVVDDEEDVRQMLAMVLSDAGFSALPVESAEAALEMLRAGEPCELVVTDQSMPGMKGSALIAELTQLRPNLPTLLITGYDRVSGLDELRGRVTVMRKPFRHESFLLQVEALLGAAPTTPGSNVVPMPGRAANRY